MRTYTPLTEGHGLVFAWIAGTGRPASTSIAEAAALPGTWRWLHLDANSERARAWIREAAGDDAFVTDTLLADLTRPTCDATEHRVVAVLRGVNLNPDARPEDMVSVRAWLTSDRLVTVVLRRALACDDVAERLGNGPDQAADPQRLLARINRRLAERMAPTLDKLNGELDDIYTRIIDEDVRVATRELVRPRATAIGLARYLAPLAESTRQLADAETPWLSESFRAATLETAERFKRISEDLLALQARAVLARDEIVSQDSERLNRRVYTLTVIAAIFLPLSVFTGALGMNVGGVPLADHPHGFWLTIGALVLAAGVVTAMLRLIRWI